MALSIGLGDGDNRITNEDVRALIGDECGNVSDTQLFALQDYINNVVEKEADQFFGMIYMLIAKAQ